LKTFAVDENNDFIVTEDSNFYQREGIDAVTQTCRQYASTLLDEMMYEPGLGIPYFQMVFARSPNIAQFEAKIRARLLECPDVLRIDYLVAKKDGETLTYNATIVTTFGRASING
jgi:hypothetical protein